MTERRYQLGLGDGSYGPGDFPLTAVTDAGFVRGPDLPNWSREYLLLCCEAPFSYNGDEVRYLLASPRYTTDGLRKIRDEGGIVGVSRVLPDHIPQITREFQPSHVSYLGAGTLRVRES
jgi:hypothetical protein